MPPVRETRIDQPHVIAGSAELPTQATAELLSASATAIVEPAAAVSATRRLRTQAQQLADHLHQRCQDVDRREAELHSQVAQHENAVRGARLWLAEQQRELAEREAELQQRQRELDERLRSSEPCPPAVAPWEPPNDQLARWAALEQAEAWLAQQRADLELREARLTENQARHQQQWESQYDALQRREREIEQDFQRRTEALQVRSEQLETRTASLDRLRNEVLQAQREALQLRLAVDEAWSQLSSSLPGVRLTHSLAESRRRLADQYRLQSEDLAEQRQQLRHLAEQLSVQRVQLQQQRRQLQQWLDQRLAELDARQAELLESEQALAARRHEIDQIIARWEAQRKTTHEQFKRVLAEIQRT